MYRIRLSRLMVIIQHTHSENMAGPYQIRMVSTTEAVFQSKRLKCAAIAASSDRRTRINGYINFLLFILWCSQQVEVECKNKRTNEHQIRAFVDPFCLSASFFLFHLLVLFYCFASNSKSTKSLAQNMSN